MALSHDQVVHIARLSRLKLSPEEVEKFAVQLTDILAWVEMLNEVSIDEVEPTAQVTGLKNVEREDTVRLAIASRDELLACSELPVESKSVKVKPVL